MAISIDWDPQSRIWTLTTGKTFDLDQISDLVEKTDWKTSKSYVWDFRALVKGPDSTDEVRQSVDLVRRTHELWAGSRAAIVVARDVDFGIARMFGAYADEIDVEYRVFREKRSALEWLRSSPVR
jgi:hypothetical protein